MVVWDAPIEINRIRGHLFRHDRAWVGPGMGLYKMARAVQCSMRERWEETQGEGRKDKRIERT